jgi:CBS domain-containing protein
MEACVGAWADETAGRIELGAVFQRKLRRSLGRRAPLAALLAHEAPPLRRDASVESAAALFRTGHTDAAPVVDEHGALVGLVTARLLLSEVRSLRTELRDGPHGARPSSASLGEVMIAAPAVLTPHTTIGAAAETMSLEGLSALPVQCPRCGFCIVTAAELLGWLS